MLTTFICPTCAQAIEADASMCGGQASCPGCSASVQIPAFQIGPGTTIGGFRLEKLIGKGGMGEVFQATQLSMDREVAVKILPTSMTGDEEAVQRFLKEARLSARLEHPNIVTVHDAGEDSGCYYYAMSYVRGRPLDERLEEEGVLPEKEALSIAISVAEALNFAWQRHQMLHRDIKPANVMLDEQGVAKVLDLGLAKTVLEDQSLTMTGMIVGTPYYMSPEQARGGADLDCRSDIYSLGSTLYHLLSGARPFESGSIMAVLARLATEEPPSLRSIRSDVSENCARVVQIMMSKDPNSRYPDYVPLIKDLKRVRANKRPLGPNGNGIGLPDLPQPGAAPPTMVASPEAVRAPQKSKNGLYLGLAAAAMVFMLIVAAVANKRNPPTKQPSKIAKGPNDDSNKNPVVPSGAQSKSTAQPGHKQLNRQNPKKRQLPTETASTPTAATTTDTLRQSADDEIDGDAELYEQVKAALMKGDVDGAQSALQDNGKRLSHAQRRDLFAQFRAAKQNGSTDTRPFGKGERFGDGRFRKNGAPQSPNSDEDDWNDLATSSQKTAGNEGAASVESAADAVCGALLDLDWQEAKTVLEKHKITLSATPEHKQQWDAATQAASLPQVILDSFQSQTGKTIAIQLQSGDVIQFIPESVDKSGIVGRRLVRNGTTTGRIKITVEMAELGVAERLKRLPPESDPIGSIMRGLVAIEAGRPDAAERLFAQHPTDLAKRLLAILKGRMEKQAEIAAKAKERLATRPTRSTNVKLIGAKPVTRPTPPSMSKLAPGSAEAMELQAKVAREISLPIEIIDTVGISYRLIPAGQFRRQDGATIRLSRPFYIGKYEVTQKQWESVTANNPSSENNANYPVDQVSWENANRFAAALCGKLGVPEGTIRLPTEAEWEYACRAGTTGDTFYDARRGKLEDFGNLLDSSAPDQYRGHAIGIFKDRDADDDAPTLAAVGKYRPNAFGLYDTYGNVFEWCSDWSGPYNGKHTVDPTGPPFGLFRIHRGGSFLYRDDFCNSSKRHQSPARQYVGGQIAFGNALGLRLVREID